MNNAASSDLSFFSFYSLGEFDNSFIVKVDPSISDAGELIKSLYYQMWFPGYFGFNWNALDDFLHDLSWIEENKVVIIHKELPKVNDENLKVYLEILRDSATFWSDEGEQKLEVLFSENERGKILKIFSL